MLPEQEQHIRDAALRQWGRRAQEDMFIEEAAEAIQALLHFRRGRATADDLISEMVDLDIMLQQVRMIINDESKWQRWHDFKLDRLASRLWPDIAESRAADAVAEALYEEHVKNPQNAGTTEDF